MSKFKFTKSQKDAINSRDGSILVSAAAGSGKTAVLVERVIARITDKNNPSDADKMLIVTFTNAAANEMKNRLTDALYELIVQNPDNQNLKRQQLLLNRAHISTIDSFCSELLRENFFKLGISPKFRIADSAELEIIKSEAIEKSLEYIYANAKKEFNDLIAVFDFGKDDRKLIETIKTLYSDIRAYPFPHSWLSEKLTLLKTENDSSESIWGKTVISYVKLAIDFSLKLAKENLKLVQYSEQIYKAYFETLSDDLELIDKINKCLGSSGWDFLHEKFSKLEFKKLKVIRNCEDKETKDAIQRNRNIIKDIVNKKLKPLFEYSDSDNKEDLKTLSSICEQLFRAVELFYENLEIIKTERNVLDFSDLLHKSLELLLQQNENGYEKTEFALSLSQDFDEILVDEYQDINVAQDMLFYALSKDGKNIFTVGDAKQSIYRFRHANPDIFINRKENLDLFNGENKNYPAKIILDKNFRSRNTILNIVNFVFSKLMSKDAGSIEYNFEEKLEFAADYYPKTDNLEVEFEILETGNENSADKTRAEAKLIAEKIIEIMSCENAVSDKNGSRNARFGDFCILLRSPKNKAKIFSEVLQLYGIPTYSESEKNFFTLQEIKTAISLLRVIDNPVQDIPLLAVLYSPVYAFSSDDIALIRYGRKHEALYFSLKEYSKKDDVLAKRCRDFLTEIENFRLLSTSMPADKLIYTVFEKTDYFSIVSAMDKGERKLAQLRTLIDYAKEYENTGYKGLSNFMAYINKLISEGSDINTSSNFSENSNLVKIISIHKSKGLEFPICFLADCSVAFHSVTNDIIIDNDLGVTLKLLNKNANILYSTLAREAVLIKEKKETISEELRLLYVAMTRAKERLIMLLTVSNLEKKLFELSALKEKEDKLHPFFVMSQNSYTNWLLALFSEYITGNRKINDDKFKINISKTNTLGYSIKKDNNKISCEETEQYDKLLKKIIDTRFNFKYDNEVFCTVPSKISATTLSQSNNDTYKYNFHSKPRFTYQNNANSTDRGTALHSFMEFVDFAAARSNLDAEIERLLKNSYISSKQFDLLDIHTIKIFLKSDLCSRIINSKKLYREFPFKTMVNPKVLFPEKNIQENDDDIMLQGVIDLLFEEENNIVIVDYKTDKIKNKEKLVEKYHRQLDLYKLAMSNLFPGKNVECNMWTF